MTNTQPKKDFNVADVQKSPLHRGEVDTSMHTKGEDMDEDEEELEDDVARDDKTE